MLAGFLNVGCQELGRRGPPAVRPSVLLVTLDTTRADAIGPDAEGATPAFDSLAARGRLFRQAYATAPETLPSHCSLMTGLYPAGHGVHENARYLSEAHPVLAERLRKGGYRTAAFVSAFVLARRFGLARGFDVYDDEMPDGLPERTAAQTTERALAYLVGAEPGPIFVWVHYYDPHDPYVPPEPFRSRYPADAYQAEVASMDEQLGRLVEAFERRAGGAAATAVVGDHGEGLGEHGEAQHGKLLYQATMRVPLALVGPGVERGVSEAAVGIRRVFHTVLDWAGLEARWSLRDGATEVVLGEAMKPFLSYGWQPQVMAVEGRTKAIRAGRLEVYDVVADPGESRDLGDGTLSRAIRSALIDYPLPSLEGAASPPPLDEEERRKLAALGYVGSGAVPVVRKDAPRPADMRAIFDDLDAASTLFVRGDYAQVVPLLERIRRKDPQNLDAALRLAAALGGLGRDAEALEAFREAEEIAPGSEDVRTYLALHYARGRDWQKAVPLLERIVAESPDRLPAVEALTVVRERQGRIEDAIALRTRIYAAREPSAAELVQLGRLAMEAGRTALALDSFERARGREPEAFRSDLELGVLYLAARRFSEAREALDRIPPSHPEYPMALFKRAQVSVLLREPDRVERIAAARRGADAATRELIATEKLFQGQGVAAP
jgi:tetratricopeptide (TPR) repeat protein